MSRFPSSTAIAELRLRYPKGCRVELVYMEDPYTTLRSGAKGTVSLVDDIGTIFVDWEDGSHLGVAYGVDRVRKI